MELKIKSVSFPEAIEFNFEEIKQELAQKVQHYESLVYSDEQIKEAKKDVAALRKFTKALSDERIKVKKQCLKPYEDFEEKVRELTAIVDKPISMIDKQVKEYEELQRQKKLQSIREIFSEMGFQPFVKLEMVMDEKWLNASVPLSRIEEQLKESMIRIGDDVFTLSRLPEYSFEATEVYKATLDLGQAVKESQRLSEQAKRKAEYEAEQARRKEENARCEAGACPDPVPEFSEEAGCQVYQLDFRVWATKRQLMLLRQYMKDNGIRFGKVE